MTLKSLAPVLTGLLVGLMFLEGASRRAAADASAFHDAALASIRSIPYEIGEWKGTDIPMPASAIALLRPNAMLARAYRNPTTGERATLLIVQCRDARDMAGHYPPICYPGSGWVAEGEVRQRSLRVDSLELNARRYEFRRASFDRDHSATIYGFFAVPGAGYPDDMPSIRKVAADYTATPFGAAQIQVVFNDRLTADREVAIVHELLDPLAQTIQLLADPVWRTGNQR